jgi:hypothetical protein
MSAAPESGGRPAVGPGLALVLSMLILPGLGQMLTGRLGRGAGMAGARVLWLPAVVIKIGLDLSAIMPDLMNQAAGGARPGLADVQAALAPLAGGLAWVLSPPLAIWFWALADSARYWRQSRGAK